KTRQFNEPRYFSGEVKRPEFYLIILNIEKQLGNAVKRRQAFNQRFLTHYTRLFYFVGDFGINGRKNGTEGSELSCGMRPLENLSYSFYT
ncbi:MAG: hypothetical protein P1P63_02135, partial [Treponemataceae bacterium]